MLGNISRVMLIVKLLHLLYDALNVEMINGNYAPNGLMVTLFEMVEDGRVQAKLTRVKAFLVRLVRNFL